MKNLVVFPWFLSLVTSFLAGRGAARAVRRFRAGERDIAVIATFALSATTLGIVVYFGVAASLAAPLQGWLKIALVAAVAGIAYGTWLDG